MVMVALFHDNLAAILIVALVALIIAFLVFRPRQRVRLTQSTPLRPHMPARSIDTKDHSFQASVAESNVTGELIGAPFRRHAVAGVEEADDFVLLKGIGPKLADMLHERGFTRF